MVLATARSRHAKLDQSLLWIEQQIPGAIADLDRLIAIDTSFPPGRSYAAFVDLLEELVQPIGFSCRRVEVPRELWHRPGGMADGARVNLIARRASGRPVCGLYFHMDTVPAAPGWKHPPLALTRDGDRLYGLGAADMKGSMAAALLALHAAQACGLALAYEPMLLFCTDEEGGLYPGIRYLAGQGMLIGHIVNFNGGAVPRIWAGCFGSINVLIKVLGQGAHAGDSTRGVNAIEASLPVLNALTALKDRVALRRSALPPPEGVEALTSRLTIAAAHGGASGGAVPALFEILVNRRYAPEESFDEALAEIKKAVREAAAGASIGLETEVVGHLSPVSDPTGPHWPRWQKALSLGFGWKPEEFRAWGATSSSDFGFVQQAGMREILLGGLIRPDRNAHAAEEHTTIGDLAALARSILAYLAADFAIESLPQADRSAS